MDKNVDNINSDQKSNWEPSLFNDAVLIEDKATYVKKEKHYTKQNEEICIICKIIQYDKDTPAYEIYRDEETIVFLNLFPYQVGHIMVCPLRHVMGYEEYNDSEIISVGKSTQKTINVLKHFGNTNSFNIGWNQGIVSGGSIKHHHIHLVPRYKNDLNFMEIIARTKPFIMSLETVLAKLKKYSPYFNGEKEISELEL